MWCTPFLPAPRAQKPRTGGTAATVYDTNNGNTSTGNSAGSGKDYYLDLDDHTSEIGTINSVIVRTYVRRDSGAWGGEPTFTIGVKTNGSSYFSGSKSQNPESYSLHSGNTYNTNPQSSSAWTWSEIDSLVAIIDLVSRLLPQRIPERDLFGNASTRPTAIRARTPSPLIFQAVVLIQLALLQLFQPLMTQPVEPPLMAIPNQGPRPILQPSLRHSMARLRSRSTVILPAVPTSLLSPPTIMWSKDWSSMGDLTLRSQYLEIATQLLEITSVQMSPVQRPRLQQ